VIGRYGPDWVTGVISDHEYLANEIQRGDAATTQRYARVGNEWYPVLCGEIVMIDTEDGRIDGRCGQPVHGDDVACPDHQADITRWMNERRWMYDAEESDDR
jgi:hypothetical protein